MVKINITLLYPQGVVVRGYYFYEIYNSSNINFINQKVEATVIEYDEKSMWLIIE